MARVSSDFVCIGGAAINRKYRSFVPLVPGSSNPSRQTLTVGGVARNVAEGLGRMGASVQLVSVVGQDQAGDWVEQSMRTCAVDVTHLRRLDRHSTAEYCAIIEPSGALFVASAAMDILEELTPDLVDKALGEVRKGTVVFADCNCPSQTLDFLRQQCRMQRARLCVNAVSVEKSKRLGSELDGVDVLFVNQAEAAVLADGDGPPETLAAKLCALGARQVVLTLGGEGHLVADRKGCDHVEGQAVKVYDVSGAGDALTAGTLFAMARGLPMVDASIVGSLLAAKTLQVQEEVVPDLDHSWFDRHRSQITTASVRRVTAT